MSSSVESFNREALQNFFIRRIHDPNDKFNFKAVDRDFFRQVMSTKESLYFFVISATHLLLKPAELFLIYLKKNFRVEICTDAYFASWEDEKIKGGSKLTTKELWIKHIKHYRSELLKHWANLVISHK